MPAIIPGDKKKHVVVGAAIAILVFVSANAFWPGNLWLPIALAIGSTTIIGFGFELFSFITGRGHAEIMDAIATVAGGALGVIAVLIFYWTIELF